jgi:VanZ family protein
MIYYIPAISGAILIFLLSTLIGAKVPLPDSMPIAPDKLGHLLAYLVLTLALGWGLFKNKRLTTRNTWLMLLGITTYGMALESIQFIFFPDRYFEWWDMLANLVGVLLAVVIIFFQIKSRQNE